MISHFLSIPNPTQATLQRPFSTDRCGTKLVTKISDPKPHIQWSVTNFDEGTNFHPKAQN